MSAIPAVRAQSGAGPLHDLACRLWPACGERWGLPGGVLEGLGRALAIAPPVAPQRPIWPPDNNFAPPIVLAGLSSADALDRAVRERAGVLQYRPRVLVVEPDAPAALAGLARLAAAQDLDAMRALLDAPGVEWFMGPMAMQQLEAWLRDHVDDALPQKIHEAGGSPELAQAIARLLGEAHARQQATLRERTATLRQWANDRPRREALRARLRQGTSLRVLVITSRFSTYMKHAAADFVHALGTLGHDARLLLEADDHTRQTQAHYLQAVLGFDPDAVVLVNYLRPQIGPVIPPHVPVVTWAQDAMGHFFAGESSVRAGPNDIVVGMLYPEHRTRLGLDESRTLAWPNAVSPAKFHRGPVGSEHDHLRCDVALMTRHSEPPHAYLARLVDQAGRTTPQARAIAALETLVPKTLEQALRDDQWIARALRPACEEALRQGFGRPPSPAMIEPLLHQAALPLADLHHRQQTARWAARICERRGWRLHLYGSGWADHPELAAHARGELAHGEPLRAAYQLAGVTIHASVRGLLHQRIAEAAMSGGLPIVRRTFEDIDRARWFELNAIVPHATPHSHADDGRPRFAIADHPGLMHAAALWGRTGRRLGVDGLVCLSPEETHWLVHTPLGKPRQPHDDPARLMVDVATVGFECEEQLESIIEQARDPNWREPWSRAIDVRVRERFAMDSFARETVELIRRHFL